MQNMTAISDTNASECGEGGLGVRSPGSGEASECLPVQNDIQDRAESFGNPANLGMLDLLESLQLSAKPIGNQVTAPSDDAERTKNEALESEIVKCIAIGSYEDDRSNA